LKLHPAYTQAGTPGNILTVVTCPTCNGSGLYTFEDPTCPTCNGKGRVWDRDYVSGLHARIAKLEAARRADVREMLRLNAEILRLNG
jgi:DnaJ-class molecular chaperone